MADEPRGAGDRLVHLLKLVADGPRRFTLSDIAARARLPQSSTHRLLQVLVRSGLVERGSGQTYRTGRELHRMASHLVSRFDLTRSARPFLEQLVADWQETSVLCAYSPTARQAIIADVVLTPHPLRFAVEPGLEISLPWGSMGRAVLAFLPSSEIEAIVRAAKAGPLTGKPRSSRLELESELVRIRADRASRYYDPQIDIAGIAAPVFGADGDILGCIGVTMPSKRYRLHEENELLAAVRSAAERLTEQAIISHS